MIKMYTPIFREEPNIYQLQKLMTNSIKIKDLWNGVGG